MAVETPRSFDESFRTYFEVDFHFNLGINVTNFET